MDATQVELDVGEEVEGLAVGVLDRRQRLEEGEERLFGRLVLAGRNVHLGL